MISWNTVIHGRSPSVNVKRPRNEGERAFATCFQGVFRYSGFATLAAGGVFFDFIHQANLKLKEITISEIQYIIPIII